MSGRTPQCSAANILPVRPMPLCTSSKMSRIPCRSHSDAQAGEKPVGRHQVTTLALDRFDQDRRDLAGGHVARKQHVLDVLQHRAPLVGTGQERPIEVRIRHVRDPGHGREEARLLGVLAEP